MKDIHRGGEVYHREPGGAAHREDAPAVIFASGRTGWRRMGEACREGEPHLLFPNGGFRIRGFGQRGIRGLGS
jgi:hypothetical protein